MNLGIYDIGKCGSTLTAEERFKIYKDCGFTHIGFYLDNNYLDVGETYDNLVKLAHKYGLIIDQVHLDYKNSNMVELSADNDYLNYIELKINECKKYGIKHIIVHSSMGNNPPAISDFVLNKLRIFDKTMEDCDINLCFENVRVNNNLYKIMEQNYNNIFICFDSGHAHCYIDEENFLNTYKNKIVCTHLHDNFGDKDLHLVISKGNINWKNISNLLSKTKRQVDYLECFPNRDETLDYNKFVEFVTNAYNCYKNEFCN